ncbi:unnamed protein product [Hymenolepis diminuta]|uniref:RUN domain-containing protein n=1 Tax=Hymenolepis diminuta TaxID=6216 RepID=A0A158QF00_HYMDI|nr:unnamed protein product [Hymenolepis diminuta]VUZ39520.1 unnamed protein product [Hymenolepis diminuta]
MLTPADVERENILAATRFTTREILEYVSRFMVSSVEFDTCDQTSTTLYQIVARLLCIIENGICHGLKLTEPNSSNSPDPWSVLRFANFDEHNQREHDEIIKNIKTGLGKTRFWIRQSLVRKKLGSNLLSVVENKNERCIPANSIKFGNSNNTGSYCFADLYSKGSLLMTESGIAFVGLLSGLDVIDFSYIPKDNSSQLDGPLFPIDYSSCIQFDFHDNLANGSASQRDLQERFSSIINEKQCLEEKISTNQITLANLTKMFNDLTFENDALKLSKTDLESEISKLKLNNEKLSNLLVRQTREMQNELEAAKRSNLSHDSYRAELERQISAERRKRLEVENVLSQEKESRAAIETEISRLQTLNTEREASLTEHRGQISEMVKLNKEFSEKLRSVTAELEATNKRAGDLQEKVDGMSSVLTAMNERCHQLKDEKMANERAMKEAIKRADQADRQCVQLQADLAANKETTQNLQSQFDEVYTDLASIKALQENLDRKSQSLRERDAMISELQRRCSEAEQTLSDMSSVVEVARLRADHAEQRVLSLSTAKWISDSEATSCALCDARFSFSRRKHHCRNCGLIFCQECSSFKMPLPSSSKPVRVCETCHNQLMERYAVR